MLKSLTIYQFILLWAYLYRVYNSRHFVACIESSRTFGIIQNTRRIFKSLFVYILFTIWISSLRINTFCCHKIPPCSRRVPHMCITSEMITQSRHFRKKSQFWPCFDVVFHMTGSKNGYVVATSRVIKYAISTENKTARIALDMCTMK